MNFVPSELKPANTFKEAVAECLGGKKKSPGDMEIVQRCSKHNFDSNISFSSGCGIWLERWQEYSVLNVLKWVVGRMMAELGSRQRERER